MENIVDLLKRDLEARALLGEAKYGKQLNDEDPCVNGHTAIQNAYEEVLDAALYLKKALMGDTACRFPHPGHVCIKCCNNVPPCQNFHDHGKGTCDCTS